MENPWNISSIFELQYFNCPSCVFKNHSKQHLVNHAYEIHPESIEYLMNINDNSLADIPLPWNESKINVKTERDQNFPENNIFYNELSDDQYYAEYGNNENSKKTEDLILKTDKKGHKCDFCEKSFSRREHLKRYNKLSLRHTLYIIKSSERVVHKFLSYMK